MTFSGTPTQLAEVVKDGDVSCIHSIQKSYFVQGMGRKVGSMQSRECFFAPPIKDTISTLNSATVDLPANGHPFGTTHSVTKMTLERIRDAVAEQFKTDVANSVASPRVDDGLGYWMDVRGVWWSTKNQEKDESKRLSPYVNELIG